MLRSKLGLLGLCVLAVGMMAFSAASAQAAPEWLVLNEKKEAKTAAELNALVELKNETTNVVLLTHLVKLKVEVRCTGSNLSSGTSLEKEGKLTSGGKAVFTGCKTFNAATNTELPECGVKGGGSGFGTVTSAAGKGQLQTNGETKIEPVTGNTFATLEFEAGCVLPSPTTVNGTLFVEDCEGLAASHLKEHLLKQGAGTSLFVGADNAEHLETSLVGSVWARLAGPHAGLLWGAMFP